MIIIPLVAAFTGAIIGAAGAIIAQIISNNHIQRENAKHRAMEAAVRLTELASTHGLVNNAIPASNNDNYARNYIRLFQIIQSC